jgi:thiosulfate dehydrogenase
MKLNICLISVLALAAAATAITREAPAADVPQVDLAEWTPPSIGSVGDDPFGKLVKYGYALFTDTPNQIGPPAPDPAKRFSRSSLTCQNCHVKAGTQPYAVPLMGVWGQFPQYRGREGEIGTLEERINGCLALCGIRNDTSNPSSVFNVRMKEWRSSIPSRSHWPKGKT